jgi:hypothetical protein
MNLELTDEQAQAVRHALEVYLSNLRAEIVKTEKHEWKAGLHKEQEALETVLEKLK